MSSLSLQTYVGFAQYGFLVASASFVVASFTEYIFPSYNAQRNGWLQLLEAVAETWLHYVMASELTYLLVPVMPNRVLFPDVFYVLLTPIFLFSALAKYRSFVSRAVREIPAVVVPSEPGEPVVPFPADFDWQAALEKYGRELQQRALAWAAELAAAKEQEARDRLRGRLQEMQAEGVALLAQAEVRAKAVYQANLAKALAANDARWADELQQQADLFAQQLQQTLEMTQRVFETLSRQLGAAKAAYDAEQADDVAREKALYNDIYELQQLNQTLQHDINSTTASFAEQVAALTAANEELERKNAEYQAYIRNQGDADCQAVVLPPGQTAVPQNGKCVVYGEPTAAQQRQQDACLKTKGLRPDQQVYWDAQLQTCNVVQAADYEPPPQSIAAQKAQCLDAGRSWDETTNQCYVGKPPKNPNPQADLSGLSPADQCKYHNWVNCDSFGNNCAYSGNYVYQDGQCLYGEPPHNVAIPVDPLTATPLP